MTFDPKKYLAQPDAAQPAFDPNAYLAAEAPEGGEPSQGVWDTFKNMAGAAADAGATTVSMGYVDNPEMRETIAKSPVGAAIGTTAGSVIPGAGFGKAGSKLTQLLGNNALTRTAGAVGASALQGGVQKPEEGESRLGNAGQSGGLAALFSTALEAINPAMKAVRGVSKYAGQKLSGLSPKETAAYVAAPELAEDLARQNREDPMGLSKRVKNIVKGDLDEAFERVSAPALEKVGQTVAGKQIQMNPAQFKGTAAGNEASRAWAAQGNEVKIDVPVFEPHQVQASPVTSKLIKAGKQQVIQPEVKMSPVDEVLKYGKPERQVIPNTGQFGYQTPTAEVSELGREFKRAGDDIVLQPEVKFQPMTSKTVKNGEVATLEDLLLPQGTQSLSAPTPMPETISMTGPQAMRAKRAAQQAASFKEALNPLAYNAADDAEAVAASYMRKAIEGVAPETKPLNDQIAEATRYSAHAKQALKTNPATILQDSESLGSVPTRSMRQFLDKHGGSNLEEMAQSLGAGRAMTDPNRSKGFLHEAVGRPVGRALLKGPASMKIDPREDNSLASILASIFNNPRKD